MTRKNPVKPKNIKFSAAIGGIKTLANGTISLTLTAGSDQLLKIMSLLDIKQDGDSLSLTAVRVKTPKAKKPATAIKQEKPKQQPRRIRRYPYKD
jgi:hypothetical protein